MGNPLFSGHGSGPMIPQNNPLGFMQRLKLFISQFRGNPQQQVQQLLDSGQMTQEQYNQLYNMAMQLKDTFGK